MLLFLFLCVMKSEWNNEMREFIKLAILEDINDPTGTIPSGDHSSLACFATPHTASAKLLVKEAGILAGVEVAQMVCQQIDPALKLELLMADGDPMTKGDIAFYITGDKKSILQAERLLLNFMQRMSGIATTTHRYVLAIAGTTTQILDTRKTTPGLRAFEKWAVRLGGGQNHRFGLYDMIMLKDNHIDFCGGIKPAILAVKKYQEEKGLNLRVEVETRTLDEVKQALDTGYIHRIMFDNFSVAIVIEAVALVNHQYETEVSGGITLDTIRDYALAGPQYISVGALTHSSKSIDLSLKVIK